MTVAVASGKGGTGKTTVAVGLALTAAGPVSLLDCDVEEPNCDLFLRVGEMRSEPVTVPVPEVDENICTGCGACGRICMYHAVVSLRTGPLFFPELCHGCGGCMRVCPTGAIREVQNQVGVIEIGRRNRVELVIGRMDVGQPAAPPVIRAVKRHLNPAGLNIIDCPPGTSCPVVTAVRGSDFVVLVTEPTPFGLNDLILAVETMRELGLRFGVVVNRCDSGDDRVVQYCRTKGIPILLSIADDRRIAETGSRGRPIVEAFPEFRRAFVELHEVLGEKGNGG